MTPNSRWHRLQHKMAPYLFVAPFLILFAAFQAWPIIKSLMLAFYNTAGPKNAVYVGGANFSFLLSDSDFRVAVKNTATFAFWSVVLQLPVALGLAILLSQKWVKGRDFFRLAFFSPQLVGSVFVGVLFAVLFVPKDGLIVQLLHALAPARFPLDTKFLGDQRLVMPAIVFTALWMYAGHHMVYVLAALQAVDRDLYEAAQVDGADGWQQFRAVTLPGIRPVVIFTLLTSTIGSFQLFELPWIMLGQTPGPNKSGLTVVMYLYQTGFVTGDLGYASTVGWTLAFMVLLISLAQLRLTGALKTES